MFGNTIRKALVALALLAGVTLGLRTDAHSQTFSLFRESTRHPDMIVWGFGGGVNDNFARGTFTPPGASGQYLQGDYAAPEAHLLMEIPISTNFMFSPRVTYSHMGSVMHETDGGDAVPLNQNISVNYQILGADALLKYSIGDLYIIGGAGVAAAVKHSIAVGSNNLEDASRSGVSIPGTPEVIGIGQAGLGYDIPVRTNRMWISPEVTFNMPFVNLATNDASAGTLHLNTLSSRLSMKFSLGQP